MKCMIKGCGGSLEMSSGIPLQTGCVSTRLAYPCNRCERLHWAANGSVAYSSDGRAVFVGRVSEKPIARVVPFMKGQEGKGYNCFTVENVIRARFLSESGNFDSLSIAGSRLFSREGEAIDRAESLGFQVEEYA